MNNERLIVLANECTSYKEGLIEGKHDIEVFDKEKFAKLIVNECCDWIDGSPANDAGQLHLTKSFIIANLKGMFRGSKE